MARQGSLSRERIRGGMVSRRRVLVGFLVVLAGLLALPVPVLRVTADGTAHSELLSPLGGTRISLSYLHSVEKTVVREEYDVRPSGIVMVSMTWSSTGAGLPDEYDEVVDGQYVRRAQTRVGKTLKYWFLPVNDATLDVGNRRVFEGPERESKLIVSVRCLPAVVSMVEFALSGDLPL